MNAILNYALHYADLGYSVFPCVPNKKNPITERGFKDATTDEEQIKKWWTEHPDANIAIATNGLFVVDVDCKGWPDDTKQAEELACAPMARTPRGGLHYFFRQPDGLKLKCTQGAISDKIDTRTNGGYIIVEPSKTEDGSYRFFETNPLDEPADKLPLPPEWLIKLLDSGLPKTTSSESVNQIPEGKRNSTLASIAGKMRSIGLAYNEINAALQESNNQRCSPPLKQSEVEKIAQSISNYQTEKKLLEKQNFHAIQVKELFQKYTDLRKPLIHDLLREGETMNVIAAPKVGKSWLVLSLAISIATGRKWLEIYKTEKGRVLIIDNELHPETTLFRLNKVISCLGIPIEDLEDKIYVLNLRGRLQDLYKLGKFLEKYENGYFQLIIIDAWYRSIPKDTDENDNGAVALLYNEIDRIADKIRCSFVLIHHTSKGNQSAKSVTDVGAGAGAQSRAADTHLTLRKHKENDVVVLDAVTRSWPPPNSHCLKWSFPSWTVMPDLDPADIDDGSKRKKKDTSSEEKKKTSWSSKLFVERFIGEEPQLKSIIEENAEDEGIPERKVKRHFKNAEYNGSIFIWKDNNRIFCSTNPQPINNKSQQEFTSKRELVINFLKENQNASAKEIVNMCDVSRQYANQIKKEMNGN